MRPTRAALTVAVTALAPALLLAGPAFAAGPVSSPAHVAVSPAAAVLETPVDEMSDDDVRVALSRILADPDSGRRVVREVNALLDSGTPEEMRAWLETGYRLAQAEDDTVALSRILADPDSGRRVIKEINALLDDSTPEEKRAWLETGYRLAQAEDDRVAIVSILNRPGISDALRAAVLEAIEGTPEEMRHFLEYGQYEVDA
ncbi:ALF repeat-containing protein [Streptomyces pratensis]|uniref:ALF repeat-containing protein n=1 Tax=Streptomyces pratensis TaxID=1169025 RepID=UPI0019319874|nr:ALF repeat-containing protein [Streptomyces pratensis]